MLTTARLPMFTLAALLALVAAPTYAEPAVEPVMAGPAIGSVAPGVKLPGLDGQLVDLGEVYEAGDTVLVVLRGYPGYQCGICSRQVTAFLTVAQEFAKADVQVVMVYPGPTMGLSDKAEEFLAGKTLPEPITMVLDPDYAFTDAYNLRWDAPRETAYPSTFVIAKGGKIEWAKISKTHGGRADVQEVLGAL
ncbi:Redoxin [Planctomycetes bacterium MalM25]|nr:Redoxin [Planctomycetes bacterium MalM25]